MKITLGLCGVAMAVAIASVSAQDVKTPVGWKTRTDVAAAVDPSSFVMMPPGWHITTGHASLLYHPDYTGRGNFSVEIEVFLFPGDSTDEYGIFLGGRDLDPAKTPAYIAFVGRKDGKGAILRGGGQPPLVDWTANDAIQPSPGTSDVKNVLRVDVNPTEVVFKANGKDVVKVPRAGLNLDGQLGFRVGKGLNIHASRLDVTYRLAPVPVK